MVMEAATVMLASLVPNVTLVLMDIINQMQLLALVISYFVVVPYQFFDVNFVLIECPTGWFHYDGDCFLVHAAPKNFDDAVAACSAFTDAKLFEPTSETQNIAIYDVVNAMFGDETEYFVGIKLDPDDPDGST